MFLQYLKNLTRSYILIATANMEQGLRENNFAHYFFTWGVAVKATGASRASPFVVLCRSIVDATGLWWKPIADIAKLPRNILKTMLLLLKGE